MSLRIKEYGLTHKVDSDIDLLLCSFGFIGLVLLVPLSRLLIFRMLTDFCGRSKLIYRRRCKELPLLRFNPAGAGRFSGPGRSAHVSIEC